MDKEFINFLKEAYTNGLCEEYRNEIRKCHEDKLQLVRLAMRQQSIPFMASKISEGTITKDYIKKTFSDFLNGFILKDCDLVGGYDYVWYFDNKGFVTLNADVAHFSFSRSRVGIPQTKCPTIYVSNKSKVSLHLEGYNALRVYLFDSSEVEIYSADETCTVLVYKYSDRCKVTKGRFCLCHDVKEFSKELKL